MSRHITLHYILHPTLHSCAEPVCVLDVVLFMLGFTHGINIYTASKSSSSFNTRRTHITYYQWCNHWGYGPEQNTRRTPRAKNLVMTCLKGVKQRETSCVKYQVTMINQIQLCQLSQSHRPRFELFTLFSSSYGYHFISPSHEVFPEFHLHHLSINTLKSEPCWHFEDFLKAFIEENFVLQSHSFPAFHLGNKATLVQKILRKQHHNKSINMT